MSPNYTQNFPTVSRGAGAECRDTPQKLRLGKKGGEKRRFLRRYRAFSKNDGIVVDGEVTEVLLLAQAGGGPGEDWVPAS